MGSPRFAWGIDVGNRALKAIRLVREGDEIKIDDFEVIDHEQIISQAGDNRESLITSALANFAQRHAIKGQWVGVGVSGQASFARFIKLPPVEPKKIPEIVRLNYTTGNYSMFAEIVCKDINQLRFVLHDELQKIKGIERTETFISLDESFSRNVQVFKE